MIIHMAMRLDQAGKAALAWWECFRMVTLEAGCREFKLNQDKNVFFRATFIGLRPKWTENERNKSRSLNRVIFTLTLCFLQEEPEVFCHEWWVSFRAVGDTFVLLTEETLVRLAPFYSISPILALISFSFSLTVFRISTLAGCCPPFTPAMSRYVSVKPQLVSASQLSSYPQALVT